MPPPGRQPDVFPALYAFLSIGGDKRNGHQLYDVKFYPYPTGDNVPLFAICGIQETLIGRIKNNTSEPFDLKWIKHSDGAGEYNSLAWTYDRTPDKPLVCITGRSPKMIHIVDIATGEKVRSLMGHGKGINDLAVSPLAPNLLFSASEDYTIRLWNLDPEYKENPCVAIFAGEAHRQPILAMNIHPNGKWMLTGGLDTSVCLWAIPSPEELARDPKDGQKNPKTIYYPHFYSTEVHDNYVDCAVFWGDLIISRASGDSAQQSQSNEIRLWQIDGFDSRLPPSNEPPVPVPGESTRSAFPHAENSRGFQKLLSFDMPSTQLFYQRFGLLDTPGMRPILVMGNEVSKYHFWDLQRIEEGNSFVEEARSRKKGGRKPKAGTKTGSVTAEQPSDRMSELTSELGASMISERGSSPASSTSTKKNDRRAPFAPIKAHKIIMPNTGLSNFHFATKSIAFSPDGTWMIGVGDNGMIPVFHRDQSTVWS